MSELWSHPSPLSSSRSTRSLELSCNIPSPGDELSYVERGQMLPLSRTGVDKGEQGVITKRLAGRTFLRGVRVSF